MSPIGKYSQETYDWDFNIYIAFQNVSTGLHKNLDVLSLIYFWNKVVNIQECGFYTVLL